MNEQEKDISLQLIQVKGELERKIIQLEGKLECMKIKNSNLVYYLVLTAVLSICGAFMLFIIYSKK